MTLRHHEDTQRLFPFALAPDLCRSLESLGSSSGISLRDVLLAAFETLVSRYTHRAEFPVGLALAGRNLQVLQADLTGEVTFAGLLGRVSAAPADPVGGAVPAEVFGWEAGPCAESPELALSFTPGQDGLSGTWAWREDRYAAETIGAMHRHFLNLLQGAAAAPERHLAQLPLLTEAEREQLLVTWNETKAAHPSPDRCVHQLFEEQARRTPGALAVSGGGKSLTYAELDRRSAGLARRLRTLGVGPDVLVGVCMERTPDLLVALLGVLKAGGAYVPMDPAYPTDRLAYMLQDAGAPVLLTQERLLAGLPAYSGTTLRIDGPELAVDLASDCSGGEAVETGVRPGHLAYVIYTSGSTGTPKGVEVSHSALCNLLHWFSRTYEITPADRITYNAGLGFDASVSEIWPALSYGASLHLPADETRLSPESLRDWLVATGVTIAFAATPMTEALVGLKWPAGAALRILYAGGEKLRVYPPADLPFRVLDAYGPTECACIVTSAHVQPAAGGVTGLPHIGRPVDNTQVYIVDAQMQPVPVGAVGQLYIGGAGLARGYRNRPDLTEARFIPNPFGPGRLYHTGDLARWRPDGNIDFLGRIDHQVKIRGFRIELGEIEAVLAGHPAVREAAALAREDRLGDRYLAAYLVGTGDGQPSVAELREHLAAKLPAYMLPAAYVWLDQMPMTRNGKVDRAALPEPDPTAFAADEGYVAPGNPDEELLAAIWGEILGVDRVGVHDNFFLIGGHSLRATRVAARVRDAFGVDLSSTVIFQKPTVAELACEIESLRQSGGSGDALRIVPVDRSHPLPLSTSQEPVWFLQQLSPGLSSYNFQATMRLVGDLKVNLLKQALTEIIRRHEVFRTTFHASPDGPVQRIHQPWAVPVPVVDISHLPGGEREEEARRLWEEEFRKPFDLAALPLIRWTLLRLASDEHLLIQVEHHFVHDGWSFTTFLTELTTLYRAFANGEPSPLPELSIQYADFAYCHRKWLESGMAERQLDYWKQHLKGCPPVLELPADRPRPPVQRFQGTAQRLQMDPRLMQTVRELNRREGTTLFMTLQAAFRALVYAYTGQTDFCLGSGVANRRWREIEPIIGMVINTVAIRVDLEGNPTFRELLGRVRQAILGGFAHSDVPFDQVARALQPERSLSHLPIYQVAFSFHNAPMPPLDLPGVTMQVTEGHSNGSAKFDLNVIAIPRAEMNAGDETDVTMVWEYDTDIFDGETITRMIGHYETILAAVAGDPELRLGELPLLTEPERRQILQGWNDTRMEYPTDQCVHELIAEQAALRPDAPALVRGAERLTYGELDRQANQLARYLRRLGLKSEELAAVYMDRSPASVVAALAVMKAGGAYLPLDPKNPAEHLSMILEDSGAKLLLTLERSSADLPALPVHVLCLDSAKDLAAMAGESDAALPESGAAAQRLAYVIYTSGSTGRPKGVEIEHRSLLNLCFWHRRAFGITAADRMTMIAGPAFDASVWEVWPHLTAGGSLHLPEDPEVRVMPERLRDWLAEEAITISFLPTPLTESVLALPWPSGAKLRTLLTGGDKLRITPPEGLPFTLVNNYGPTESTVVSTFTEVQPGASSIPIGRPVDNVQVYVLDQHLRPVPAGVPGELFVGGDSLARGYRGRPDLTEERFVPNPFGRGRLYRTGDLVRYRPDGQIEFLGRTDFQVKIRGFRIELGEIETVLAGHPAVREAVVLVREDEPGRKQLVAYVVPRRSDDREALTGELQAWLKARLPEYMVPAAFVLMESLPVTPNGKVDRKALPAPVYAADAGSDRAAAPRTPAEEALAEIWAEVLGVQSVSIHDNFFVLGGHSLMTARVMTRVKDRFGVELSIAALFEAPTIAELAVRLADATAAQMEQDELARMLERLDELTEEEADRLLAQLQAKED